MGVEVDGDHVYIAELSGNRVTRFTRTTGTAVPFAVPVTLLGPQALAFPPAGSAFAGGLYVSRGALGAIDGSLIVDRVDLATGLVTNFSATPFVTTETWPFNIAFSNAGELLQIDSGGPDTVVRFSNAGARLGATGDTGENLSGMATAKGSPGFGTFTYIVKYTPDFLRINDDFSFTSIPLTPATGSSLLDVAFPPPNTCFGDLAFISEKNADIVHAVASDGAQTTFASGFTFGTDYISGGLAFSPSGDALSWSSATRVDASRSAARIRSSSIEGSSGSMTDGSISTLSNS